MLAKKVILSCLLKKNFSIKIPQVTPYAARGIHDVRKPIGNREWLGYGINGHPNYVDRPDFPIPAIRFRETTGELIALREKEKGDWKKLTIEEKKKLYRASFCQTLAEVEAPTGQWKSTLGWTLVFASMGMLLYIFCQKFIYRPKPHTFSDEHRESVLRTMIDLKMGHITGVSSKWDYEKDDWKK